MVYLNFMNAFRMSGCSIPMVKRDIRTKHQEPGTLFQLHGDYTQNQPMSVAVTPLWQMTQHYFPKKIEAIGCELPRLPSAPLVQLTLGARKWYFSSSARVMSPSSLMRSCLPSSFRDLLHELFSMSLILSISLFPYFTNILFPSYYKNKTKQNRKCTFPPTL